MTPSGYIAVGLLAVLEGALVILPRTPTANGWALQAITHPDQRD